jgi:1-acyl-sn-glycerol-3-phosphate acyltransferase
VRPYYSAARLFASGGLGIFTGWEVRGQHRVPKSGGVIIASNHISFWDPPLIGAAVPRELWFLTRDDLLRTPLLGPLIRSMNAIPIRRGMADLSGMTRAIERLKQGGALLVFPEGGRMQDGELHPARPGVGMMAVHADVPIVPCCITGSDRPAKWWTRRARVRLWLGPAWSWRDLAGGEGDLTPGRMVYQRVGDAVMREIAILRTGQQTEASRGVA